MEFNDAKQLIEEFFNGKFEVKKFLGEGSFAKVYLVNHNYLDTLMAMKIVKEPLSPTTNRKDVFHEVMLASQLRHENIINIYDAAEITFGEGRNHAYFLMEYVPGGDLGDYLTSFVENNLFMPIERCLILIKQILEGLNTLHSANPPIIHRDLKLNNVLLSFNADGGIVIKISDFGFAKEVTTSISDIDIAGTRPYMAPELFKKEVSTKSDIYAVGVMFYQLLTNHYPYDVDRYSNDELIDLKPWNDDLKAPSFYNEKVSGNLEGIVLKCLEMNPQDRYDDAEDLLEDVEKAIDEIKSKQIPHQVKSEDNYGDDYADYIINDEIEEAFRLAKCENRLGEAIEILENQVLKDYNIRRYYGETLRIWKSKRPDLKLISKAFTVNLQAKNYQVSCNLLKEAIAYNPLLKNKYNTYIELWEILDDLNNHKSLFKAVMLLENLMKSNSQINAIYKNILSTLKTYSIGEIVAKSITLANENQLFDASNLMEFAVIVDSQIRQEYAYMMSLWKQNMKMHFKTPTKTISNTMDYGIDLGTSDSLISYYNNGNPIVIKNHITGEDFTPSAIAVVEGNLEVGAGARDAILKNSPDAVGEFKKDMGFNLPFTFQKTSMEMLPEELSSEILKDLRVSAYSQCGVNVEDAVIAVPANSNPLKTRAVIDAAELAGFKSYNLILEPIAVSLAYGLKKENGVWLIYDMGGSTFNATLIREKNGGIEKLQTVGLDNLGGNTFDWKIVNELLKPKIVSDLNLDDFRHTNPKYSDEFAILKNAAESAKKELTKSPKADIHIDNLFEDYDFNYTLKRENLREISEVLIKHTFELSRNLLKENSFTDEGIEKIILVGGSTLSPLFRQLIADEFDIEIESGLNPLTVVAKGASIYAGSIEKPHRTLKKDDLSMFLDYDNGEVNGRIFADDLKPSFLGYQIEFKNDSQSIKIPLDIDGRFKFRINDEYHDIILHHNNSIIELDEKSPKSINNGNIHIPYFDEEFRLNEGLDIDEVSGRYFKLVGDIEYLMEYEDFKESDLQKYIEKLLEIARKDRNAINHANIYITHLEKIVSQAKNDLEFAVLLENVSNKIEIVRDNELFETENIDEIVENKDLEKLREIHTYLIDRYVELNRNEVIEQCFFNLKQEGIFTTNWEIADELIMNGHDVLNSGDFSQLLDVVNRLYEMDERRVIL